MGEATPTTTRWTTEQQDGVESVGENLVVSAAAGSGKTAVLAARFVRLVTDGGVIKQDGEAIAQGEPCGVDRLLVVTFTNAAARQMRDRIATRLADAANAAGETAEGARLHRELMQLPRAAIGTLSSFCAQLVRRYFHAAGVDPTFGVLDDDQARLLRRQAARDVLEERFNEDDGGAFHGFVDDYFDGRDDALAQTVISLHNLLTSVPDPVAWRAEAVHHVTEAAEKPLAESQWGQELVEAIHAEMSEVEHLAAEADRVAAKWEAEPKLEKFAAFTRQWAEHAREIEGGVAAGQLSEAAELLRRDWKAKPTPRGAVEGKEEIDAALEALRALFDKKSAAATLLARSAEDWQRGLRSAVAGTRLLMELVDAFERRYQAEKTRLRSLDFADLERHAYDLLRADRDGREPSAIALEQRRRYEHVLVDESQDINELQDRLLRLLSRGSEASAERPNLFLVGDVKQSIYRFRLAEPKMFLERLGTAAQESARLARVIDLQRNFRSRPRLLESINTAFGRLMRGGPVEIDYHERHALNPDPAYPPAEANGFDGAPVEIHVIDPAAEGDDEDGEADGEMRDLERIEREAVLIANRLAELRKEGRVVQAGDATEPFEYRHAAVLMRSQRFNSERFAAALRQQGVPCHGEVGTGFFAATEVRDVLGLLRLLDNRRQDVPLASVLRSPLAGLPAEVNPIDLLARVRLSAGGEATFFEAAERLAQSETPDCLLLREVNRRLEAWRSAAARLPTADLVWKVLTESGYLAHVAGLVDGSQREANLLELHRRAGQFDAFRRDGLGAFLSFLEALEESGEVGQPPVVSAADNVVRVMSVHAAKGLEFPVVFLADCGKQHNLADLRKPVLVERTIGAALPAVDHEKQIRYDSLGTVLASRELKRAALAEELRVLYVAMTRAREHLICVGHAYRDATKEAEAWQATAGLDRLPGRDVLGARSFLDWLGLAAAGNEAHYIVQKHAAGGLSLAPRQGESADVPAAVRKLRPPSPPPPTTPEIEAALRRFSESYAHAETARSPAASSFGGDRQPVLARPRFIEPSAPPSPGELQQAARVALRHLDFSARCDAASVRAQLEEMVRSHRLSDRAAAKLDVEALAWLASAIAEEVHTARRVLRDVPVHAAADAGTGLDRTMLRGQVPLLMELQEADIRGPLKSSVRLVDVTLDGHEPPGLRALAKALRQLVGDLQVDVRLADLSARRWIELSD